MSVSICSRAAGAAAADTDYSVIAPASGFDGGNPEDHPEVTHELTLKVGLKVKFTWST